MARGPVPRALLSTGGRQVQLAAGLAGGFHERSYDSARFGIQKTAKQPERSRWFVGFRVLHVAAKGLQNFLQALRLDSSQDFNKDHQLADTANHLIGLQRLGQNPEHFFAGAEQALRDKSSSASTC